jgi:4-carboxymuconolactone decarboxylase
LCRARLGLHGELLILRTAWLSRSPFDWSAHADKAPAAGVTPVDLARVATGADAPGWDGFEAALVRSAGKLHHHSFISEPTWQTLKGQYSTHQLMDAVF